MIAVDAMGGDHGPGVMVAGACQALQRDAQLRVRLFGREAAIQQELRHCIDRLRQRIEVVHCEDCIAMDAKPTQALRRGQGSSLWLSLEDLQQQRSDACVSAGNTGAMMLLSRKLVGMLPGIDRPALMTWLPAEVGPTYLLDLGANVGVKPRHLLQFAVMGSIAVSQLEDIDSPSVGLLNVGREDSKGSEPLQVTAERLKRLPINYAGFVEGDDIYKGSVNVVVCDGLIGNVVLKSSEGLAKLLFNALKTQLRQNIRARLFSFFGRPALQEWVARFDPSTHNGAAMLGLAKIVVKSHGGADAAATSQAIVTAATEARRGVPVKIQEMMESVVNEAEL